MIEFSQLRCFVAVAEELHFRRAAARLNMTQPPLSRQIQLLEHALGITLLLRGSRSVQLTPAGEAFLRDARRMLNLAETAADEARRVAKGEVGQITIGFTAASGYGLLPQLVALLRRELPEITLNLREMVSQDQLEALRGGQLDLGLLRPTSYRPGIMASVVQRESLLVALPHGHRLRGDAAVAIEALGGEALITYPPIEGRYLHDVVVSVMQLAGVVPARVQYVSQTHSILALVGAGLGIALVPEAAAKLCPSEVLLKPLADPATPRVELALAWRVGNENPAFGAVMEVVRRVWGLG
ncbi:LysR family transcriptional regulator [Acetobacteraceae bacterium H6797]|nr:LysR family transcriptional regulator [Acetobacteraceae bacterium H6797]